MRTFVDPEMPEHDWNEPPRPAAPEAVRLAEAMIALNQAAEALETARGKASGYTGQYSAEDFYKSEEDRYYRAAEAFADAVVAVVSKGQADET
ncbi:hypothetical protein G6L37_07450 [Agrobacterium rubi]|nr:hypothetical protein [Agrobacterium rubi]NTF25203.1 hypothetical protein [Agrobacterium rubi]